MRLSRLRRSVELSRSVVRANAGHMMPHQPESPFHELQLTSGASSGTLRVMKNTVCG